MTASRVAVSICALMAVAATSTYGTPWTWTTLNYPGAGNSYPHGIDGGNVVGYYNDIDSRTYGILYNGTTWTFLNYPKASFSYGTYLMGISGNKVVGFGNDTSNREHSYLFDGTTWTTLDHPEASSFSTAAVSRTPISTMARFRSRLFRGGKLDPDAFSRRIPVSRDDDSLIATESCSLRLL